MTFHSDHMAAFPVAFEVANGDGSKSTVYQMGMTLRDYFAAKALQGFMANKANPMHFQPKEDAAWAYAIADAMLKARQQ